MSRENTEQADWPSISILIRLCKAEFLLLSVSSITTLRKTVKKNSLSLVSVHASMSV